jgi:hypothetical protein
MRRSASVGMTGLRYSGDCCYWSIERPQLRFDGSDSIENFSCDFKLGHDR